MSTLFSNLPCHSVAKPKKIVDFDEELSRTKLVRLGSNDTLICPFENIDSFEWIKNGMFPINDAASELQLINATPNIEGNNNLYQFGLQFDTLYSKRVCQIHIFVSLLLRHFMLLMIRKLYYKRQK